MHVLHQLLQVALRSYQRRNLLAVRALVMPINAQTAQSSVLCATLCAGCATHLLAGEGSVPMWSYKVIPSSI